MNVLIVLDEAHFNLLDYISKQNFRWWNENNSKKLQEKPVQREMVTSWCGVSAFGVIGTYLFEEHTRSVTVDTVPCCTTLGNFLSMELRRIMHDAIMCFQQDGVSAHTTRESMKKMKTKKGKEQEQEERKKEDRKED